jgi:large subunit ribosomal protein L9
MKVLLCEDIDRLGWLGDVVEVKTGYARNYLLPQGLAKIANEASIRSIAEEKARRAEQRKLDGKRLEEAVKAIEGAEAVVAAKANELGHLFGSVNERQIAGFEVRDEIVQLPEHIKEIGTHPVTLKFRDDLTATINVVVVPDKQDEPDAKAETS